MKQEQKLREKAIANFKFNLGLALKNCEVLYKMAESADLRRIRIEIANLEAQLEDFIGQAKQMNQQKLNLEQEVANLKKQLEDNGNK